MPTIKSLCLPILLRRAIHDSTAREPAIIKALGVVILVVKLL